MIFNGLPKKFSFASDHPNLLLDNYNDPIIFEMDVQLDSCVDSTLLINTKWHHFLDIFLPSFLPRFV